MGSPSRVSRRHPAIEERSERLQAVVNLGYPSWINVSVGIGRWPAAVSGLLANAGNNVNAIQSRGGTVLTAPFRFDEFYGLYGQSWRVPP